ncbi:carbohydrate ABC transporter permease [Alicyclobacillus fodiniaquatilis]|uniref:Carbohydrate ABC transporter permease n=1 Tax=Alicyclobacillus fodiniaquatilis TaxID=1661150 RepID=A0ABW4JQG7_9BACL
MNDAVNMVEHSPELTAHTSAKKRRRKVNVAPYLMILPSLLFVLIFAYYPAVDGLVMSFFNWDGFNSPTFIGLHNFVAYLTSGHVGVEVFHLAVLTAGGMIVSLSMPLLAAELLYNHRSRLGRLYKPLLVIPMVIPPIVTFEIWGNIFNPQSGLLNDLLRTVGLSSLTNTWLANPVIAIYCLLFVGFPWVSNLYLLIYLAGLQNIPTDLYDAFALDGKSIWKRIQAIDIPMLMGQIRLVAIFSIIASIQHFVVILVLTQGGPGYATMVPGVDMYNSAFSYDEYGLGMAIGALMFLAVLLLTLLTFRFRKKDGMA